jgi:hypothetical protein
MSKIVLENKYFEGMYVNDVFKNLLNKSFPVKVSYQLSIVLKEIENLSDIYFKEKKKLITEHAIKDKDQNPVEEDGSVKIKDPQKFMDELNELLDFSNTLTLEKIPVDLEELDKRIPGGMKLIEINFLKPLIEIK